MRQWGSPQARPLPPSTSWVQSPLPLSLSLLEAERGGDQTHLLLFRKVWLCHNMVCWRENIAPCTCSRTCLRDRAVDVRAFSFGYSDIQIFRYSDIRIFWYSDIRIFWYSDNQIFWYSDILIFGYSDIRVRNVIHLIQNPHLSVKHGI